MDNLISRQAAIDALNEQIEQCDKALSSFDISTKDEYAVKVERVSLVAYKEQLEFLPSAQPEQRWIPVTLETLPNPNSVVVVCGKKGTWDYGTYRGWYGDIHSWWWKKNTIKHVYWWMYKDDALPEPHREE